MWYLYSLASLLMLDVARAYTTEALADQVTSLPGAENLDITFNQFSGYLKISETKNMHYWMVRQLNMRLSYHR
jgi:hypothetical protein